MSPELQRISAALTMLALGAAGMRVCPRSGGPAERAVRDLRQLGFINAVPAGPYICLELRDNELTRPFIAAAAARKAVRK
jgi:hypothetical protein